MTSKLGVALALRSRFIIACKYSIVCISLTVTSSKCFCRIKQSSTFQLGLYLHKGLVVILPVCANCRLLQYLSSPYLYTDIETFSFGVKCRQINLYSYLIGAYHQREMREFCLIKFYGRLRCIRLIHYLLIGYLKLMIHIALTLKCVLVWQIKYDKIINKLIICISDIRNAPISVSEILVCLSGCCEK